MQGYDLKVLAARFKSVGLNLTEDAVKSAVKETLGWFVESAKASETPFDDVALIIVPQLEKAALDLADKIDGEVG